MPFTKTAAPEHGDGQAPQAAEPSIQELGRWAAMHFSSDNSGVRRTSEPPVCADPPAATRLAVSLRPASRLSVTRSRVAVGSKRPSAAGRKASAMRLSESCDIVPMSMPAKVTDSASRFSRRPLHSGHTLPTM